MIVNDSLKTIYLHNPKSGGTFLREIYSQWYTRDEAYKYWKVFEEKYNTDLGHINYLNIARFIPDYREFRIVTMLRNPFNRFVSAWRETCLHHKVIANINNQHNGDIERITEYLLSLNFYEQDLILRNNGLPWLQPQTYFVRENTIKLHYELPGDWFFLLNVFGIRYPHVKIRDDYPLTNRSYDNIRKLYPEDEDIFNWYDKKVLIENPI